jgi:hypothetical protein
MGLTAPGEGERAIHEGWVERDGKLPVNVSGRAQAKGHPVGATGVSMHVMSAMQLSGTAPGGLQLTKARIGGVFNMGGAASPTTSASSSRCVSLSSAAIGQPDNGPASRRSGREKGRPCAAYSR